MKKNIKIFLLAIIYSFPVCADEHDRISIKTIAENCNGCHGYGGGGVGIKKLYSIRNKNYQYFIDKMTEYRTKKNSNIMNKLNFTSKKFKQRFLSINNSIESFFNKIKFFKSNFKKKRNNKE